MGGKVTKGKTKEKGAGSREGESGIGWLEGEAQKSRGVCVWDPPFTLSIPNGDIGVPKTAAGIWSPKPERVVPMWPP